MLIIKPFWMTLLRAPEDGTGGGGDGGDPAAAAGGGGEDDDAYAAGDGGDPGGGSEAKWWEDKRFDETTQGQLKALGLTTDDPLDAVTKLTQMERAAKQKLGKSADQLMDRPGEGQDIAEWMRQNGEVFGVPENAEGYKIAPPDDWPKDAPWDTEFESKARELAHKMGMPNDVVQAFASLYAGQVKGMLGAAEQDLQQSMAAMQEDLQKDWGNQYDAKVSQAQQAFSLLAEKAGLDQDAMTSVAQVLKGKVGDANIMRLFAAVGDAAGEDMAAAIGKSGGSMGQTPADARAALEAMKAPESEYQKEAAKVRNGGSRTRYNELHQQYLHLQKVASQG